jgi:TRAP-type C4-dicarboxylate transport system permease small subunit
MQESVDAEIAFKYIWVYTAFPIIGAMCALAFYEFVFKKAREECNKPAVEEHVEE